MKKIAIMQPTFMPYIGFFALIDYVDEFIFLDNVQFDKRSWQQRNYIKSKSKKELINIPVLSKNKFKQKILDVKIDNVSFKIKKLLNKIIFCYKKSKYFNEYFNEIEKILIKNHNLLLDLNSELIFKICELLNIKTEILYASKILDNDKFYKIDFLKEILLIRNCNKYISTIGSKDYLKSLTKFPNSNIEIQYFEFNSQQYEQQGNNFIPNLSILDLLFNEGKNSVNIMRENFKLI